MRHEKKVRYRTRAAAQASGAYRINQGETHWLYVYWCRRCRGYHLTKRKEWVPDADYR